MMQAFEVDGQDFEKQYKYSSKEDENKFNVKFQLVKTEKDQQQPEKIKSKSIVHEEKQIKEVERKKVETEKKREKVEVEKTEKREKKEKKKHERFMDWDKTQYEEYKQYNKLNHKKIKFIKDLNKQNEHNQLETKNRKARRKQERRLKKFMNDDMGFEDFYEEGEIFKFKKSHSIDLKSNKEIPKPFKNENKKRRQRVEKRQKREHYYPYLSIEQIEQSRELGEGKYFKGRVDFNQRIKWFGKIFSKEVEGDLSIEHSNKNRAIHDDEVYFQIVSEKQGQKIQCKVVAILPWKNNKVRQFVGKIQYSDRNQTYYLVPINKRIISFNIKINQLNKKALKNKNQKYFLAEFIQWSENQEFPYCKVLEEYGKIGQIQTETGALLITHGVHDEEYKEDVIEEGLEKFIKRIDETGEYSIEKSEIQKRIDLRQKNIFTIDPLTARDFDDALSIQYVGKQKDVRIFEIGVHIADASFFVEEGGLIDQEAQKRTTSVYLVHRVLPMLPRILCQTMCSLNPGLERLTLSVWFKITEEGQLIPGCRYDKSVIKSKARFTYEQAQLIIDKKISSQKEIEKGFGCREQKDFEKIAQNICLMNSITSKIRQKRTREGSLIIQTSKKSFVLDENWYPINYNIKERFPANFLVQELMLLANQKVGQIIVQHMRPCAVLRKHKFPGTKKIQKFETFTKKINQSIKVNKEVKIQEKLNQIMKDPKVKKCIKQILNYELIFLLEMAEYFVVQDTKKQDWLHYALNMPIYTHFTSPIRRYPDIMVHRQLSAIIDSEKTGEKLEIYDYKNIKELISKCNKNKLSAKKVSSGCEKIFLCLYLKNNPVDCKGVLTGITEWGFNVSVPQYDFRNTIELKELKDMKMIKYSTDSKQRKYMQVQCTYDKGEVTNIILKEMQQVSVRLLVKEGFPIDYMIRLSFPHPQNPKQMIVYG